MICFFVLLIVLQKLLALFLNFRIWLLGGDRHHVKITLLVSLLLSMKFFDIDKAVLIAIVLLIACGRLQSFLPSFSILISIWNYKLLLLSCQGVRWGSYINNIYVFPLSISLPLLFLLFVIQFDLRLCNFSHQSGGLTQLFHWKQVAQYLNLLLLRILGFVSLRRWTLLLHLLFITSMKLIL